jgi:dehydrogenase/reductase SDR family protein 12
MRSRVIYFAVSSLLFFKPKSSTAKRSMSSFGQFAATSQFYLYGRSKCTRTGWEAAKAKYPKPDILEDESLNLTGKVYMITGANTGIGRGITDYLASKGATIYMVCRNPTRANEAKDEIVEKTKSSSIHVLLCDCSLEADVRRMWGEFLEHRRSEGSSEVQLHGLICNAGALLNEKTLTSEGVEVTFAAHLLFGTYLLGSLAIHILEATPGSRFIAVSSGGMYNTKFPDWDIATATGNKAYDGQLAYAFAKRGQVLLCEKWTEKYPKVKFVSCHPGWTLTEGVEAAYGAQKSYLEPLRTTWQGAEGIIWLCVADAESLEGGAFYLDRSPQVKHIAGKNTVTEIIDLSASFGTQRF